MSLGWVFFGTLFQLMLAFFLFMMGAFAGGAVVNGTDVSKFKLRVVTFSLYVLPALCLIRTGLVIHFYSGGGTADAYWWYAMPVISAVFFLWYVQER